MSIVNVPPGESRKLMLNGGRNSRCAAAQIPYYENEYHILKMRISAVKIRALPVKHAATCNKIPATAV
ncbi:hypothetical protein [Noviherbaspirillum pedocola]|uniref:Uncharacterized protein n=1 Tax=Noviherbaspirillum pedocola TaxID=2801341 RepID=A0A934W7G5_9BURK|nr:hypothetical protein [Noviherbaspirillum pedocola]MBK4737412.1 hypothetical protein [Noviherbaspirillum pedocola]